MLAPFVFIAFFLVGCTSLIQAGIAFYAIRTEENADELDVGGHIPADFVSIYDFIAVVVAVAGKAAVTKVIVVRHKLGSFIRSSEVKILVPPFSNHIVGSIRIQDAPKFHRVQTAVRGTCIAAVLHILVFPIEGSTCFPLVIGEFHSPG